MAYHSQVKYSENYKCCITVHFHELSREPAELIVSFPQVPETNSVCISLSLSFTSFSLISNVHGKAISFLSRNRTRFSIVHNNKNKNHICLCVLPCWSNSQSLYYLPLVSFTPECRHHKWIKMIILGFSNRNLRYRSI